jgi:hypothetical protein
MICRKGFSRFVSRPPEFLFPPEKISNKSDGVYAVAFVGVARRKFPLPIVGTFNKSIKTKILPEQNLSGTFHWFIASK